MGTEDLPWAHTRAEWDQAWSQSRHLETMRGQYLGFFFTAVLGVTAVVGPKVDVDTARSLVVIAALALVLELLSAALYLAVVRLNSVYYWYQRIIFAIRDETLGSPPAAVDLSAFATPPSPSDRPRWAAMLATTSGVSRTVPRLGVYSFAAILAAIMVRVATMPHRSTTAIVICAGALAAGIAIAAFSIWVLPPIEADSQVSRPDSQHNVPT
jgi:hypothetical protein